ncbi:hypothetical protein ACPPVO_02540 [Dactylosporangium sp. McL0621]|uniref:hypothetical protein n=1 Tax=Dactylosporangium sp. McL0621 TaxID=3415678 RepID=UPI003CE8F67C
MARGLPAVASRVGGVPELLGADRMVPPGDRARTSCCSRTSPRSAPPAACPARSPSRRPTTAG